MNYATNIWSAPRPLYFLSLPSDMRRVFSKATDLHHIIFWSVFAGVWDLRPLDELNLIKVGILALLALACAPGAFIIGYIYLRDRFEPEPAGLLVKSFFFGILSVVVTLLVSLPLMRVFPIDENSLSEQAVHAFLLVALIEEGSKFLFVRGLLYRNKNFNEPYDGIIYAVMVSMGFATLENIMYSVQHGFGVAVLRMFTAVPAHATFAILMGYFLGKEKFEKRENLYGFFALGSATFLHGAYDYCLFVDFVPGIWAGAAFSLAIGIGLSLAAIRIHQSASPFRPGNSPLPVMAETQPLDAPALSDLSTADSQALAVCTSCGYRCAFDINHSGKEFVCPNCTSTVSVTDLS